VASHGTAGAAAGGRSDLLLDCFLKLLLFNLLLLLLTLPRAALLKLTMPGPLNAAKPAAPPEVALLLLPCLLLLLLAELLLLGLMLLTGLSEPSMLVVADLHSASPTLPLPWPVNEALGTGSALLAVARRVVHTSAAVLNAAVLNRMLRGRHSRKKQPTSTW
jgi:hypothetical protein